MHKKTMKKNAKSKSKPKSKLKSKPTPKLAAASRTRKAPVAAADGPAKRIFVRFGTADLKEGVRKAADSTGASLSAYIAAAAVKAAKEGFRKPTPKLAAPMGTRKTAIAAADDPYAKRISVRFDTAELKKVVLEAADAAGASLSAYIAAAAVKAAEEGFRLEMKPQAVPSGTAA